MVLKVKSSLRALYTVNFWECTSGLPWKKPESSFIHWNAKEPFEQGALQTEPGHPSLKSYKPRLTASYRGQVTNLLVQQSEFEKLIIIPRLKIDQNKMISTRELWNPKGLLVFGVIFCSLIAASLKTDGQIKGKIDALILHMLFLETRCFVRFHTLSS